ncbi:hypothetical protein ACOSQ2_000460 [Xanthoceras sorbifolium]
MDSNISMTLSGHPSSPNNYVLNGKIMLGSVILLFLVIAILVSFHTYARWLFSRRRRLRDRRLFFISSPSAAANTTTSNTSVTNQALDLSILKSIPTFVYSSTTHHHDQLLECAVCLSEFQKNEKGRALPKCNHAFHVDCIDMWFQSHSNCPLCRAPVQPSSPVQPGVISVEEAVSVSEPAGLSSEREEADLGCSSRSLPPSELLSVSVEVPRGDFRARGLDDMGLGLPEGSGFKSLGNRVISLKRIWSV